MAGVALLEHGPHSSTDPFSFVCRGIIAGSYEFKEGRASERASEGGRWGWA